MDLFELFDTDNDDRRAARGEQQPVRRKGVRGFFTRWMETFQDDDDDGNDRRKGEEKRRRGDSDFGWD